MISTTTDDDEYVFSSQKESPSLLSFISISILISFHLSTHANNNKGDLYSYNSPYPPTYLLDSISCGYSSLCNIQDPHQSTLFSLPVVRLTKQEAFLCLFFPFCRDSRATTAAREIREKRRWMDKEEWRRRISEHVKRNTYGARYLLRWLKTPSSYSAVTRKMMMQDEQHASNTSLVVWKVEGDADAESDVAARDYGEKNSLFVVPQWVTAMKRCLFQVFLHLDYRDLLSCAQVCKLWRTVGEDPRLWKRVFDETMRWFAGSKTYSPESYPFIEG